MTPSSQLSAMPGHLIRRLHQHSGAVFQDRMRSAGYDLTSVQFAALATLRDNPDIDQASLAGLIAYDRATIGGVVDRLCRKGLIERQIKEEDRRARKLNLTARGKAELLAIGPVVQALQDDILGALTANERAIFIRLASKAVQSL